MDKERICQTFFHNDVDIDEIVSFTETTPQKNIISGYMALSHNEFLGSMIITHVKTKTNEFDTLQFVHAMPKIHYLNNSNRLLKTNYYYAEHVCFEKLDGTCLIFYPLFDNANQLIEIVPKTRAQPVANDYIIEMLSYIDMFFIKRCFESHPDVILFFELFGVLNRHEIFYPQTYIDIRLIGVYINKRFLDGSSVENFAEKHYFQTPRIICYIYAFKNTWSILWDKSIEIENIVEHKRFSSRIECIQYIQDVLQEYNNIMQERTNRLAIEGTVINGVDENNQQIYIKIKPQDIIEQFALQNGVPLRYVRKEVRKYFDEYGYDVINLYQKDKLHYYNFVIKNLQEEFDNDVIFNPKTKVRIEQTFSTMLEAKTPNIGVQNIAHDLVNKYPHMSVQELMQIFAKEYPTKKKQSRMIYSILSKIVKEV